MTLIYKNILKSVSENKPLLAVLLDPEKFSIQNTKTFIKKVNASMATHIFVGGSTVDDGLTQLLICEIKKNSQLPIVIFPGNPTQISNQADALLFLSLISGRNPDYLIGKHVDSISKLKDTSIEIISTGYILVESGIETAVERVTNTKPMSRNNIQDIVNTSIAGFFLGMKLIYLEAGSGALKALSPSIIAAVKKNIEIPLIVGGGIKSKLQIEEAYKAGADLVVIGTAFEEDESFFEQLKR